MRKILIFGGAGQLGRCFHAIAEESNYLELAFRDQSDADISDIESLRRHFEIEKPSYVINCAAYTAVDQAEDEADRALVVNRDGVFNLACLCKEFNATLVHISTDFVLEGKSVLPQTEESATNPVNVYGRSKLEGEKAIKEIIDHYFIFRTSWLYSEYGTNFLKTMLRLGNEKPELRIIADQFGSPTYAIDLARAIVQVISSHSSAYGIYNYSNLGIASWYDFAKAIFELSEMTVKVIPISSAEYLTKARRPPFSIMDKSKAETILSLTIPHWHDSLKECLIKIQK